MYTRTISDNVPYMYRAFFGILTTTVVGLLCCCFVIHWWLIMFSLLLPQMKELSKLQGMYCMLYLTAFYLILYLVCKMIDDYDQLPARNTRRELVEAFMRAENVSLYWFLAYYPVHIFQFENVDLLLAMGKSFGTSPRFLYHCKVSKCAFTI